MPPAFGSFRGRSLSHRSAREPDPDQVLQKDLLRFLTARERSELELRNYLKRRGHDSESIEQAITEMIESGYVDDRRFAEMFMRDRRRLRPMSRSVISRDLRNKGVAEETIAGVFENADPPWDESELALAAASRRWERWQPEKRYQKAVSFLQRRGFANGVIHSVLDRLRTEADTVITTVEEKDYSENEIE